MLLTSILAKYIGVEFALLQRALVHLKLELNFKIAEISNYGVEFRDVALESPDLDPDAVSRKRTVSALKNKICQYLDNIEQDIADDHERLKITHMISITDYTEFEILSKAIRTKITDKLRLVKKPEKYPIKNDIFAQIRIKSINVNNIAFFEKNYYNIYRPRCGRFQSCKNTGERFYSNLTKLRVNLIFSDEKDMHGTLEFLDKHKKSLKDVRILDIRLTWERCRVRYDDRKYGEFFGKLIYKIVGLFLKLESLRIFNFNGWTFDQHHSNRTTCCIEYTLSCKDITFAFSKT